MKIDEEFESEVDADEKDSGAWMDECDGVDQFGHDWQMEWIDSDKPHPGYAQDIYGGYDSRCNNCGKLSSDMKIITKCEGKNGRDNP